MITNLFESWMHEGPYIHGCHLPVIIPIITDHPGEHLTDHPRGDHLHPVRHLGHELQLVLGQTDKAPTHRVLVLAGGLPDHVLYPPLTLGQQGLDSVSWNIIIIYGKKI